jgi:acetyltransferase-like isoleucine patch superfamily enzyme
MKGGDQKVQIAALLTLPGKRVAKSNLRHSPGGKHNSGQPDSSGGLLSSFDVLGSSLLQRTVDKLTQLGAIPPVILREHATSTQLLPPRSNASGEFLSSWENAVTNFVAQGVEILCLARVSAYSDLDYADLLQFHLQTGTAVTQAYGPDGSLDIAMVTTSALRADSSSYRKSLGSLIAHPRRYTYNGYVNRMRNFADLCRLSQDGLYGRCGLHPKGNEIREGVWAGEGVHIDESAQIVAPAFIGDGSRIASGCVISGASTIERNCEIDCGTSIHQSCVLQDTYVGVALNVNHSIVNGGKLFHLGRNVEIHIADERLVGDNRRSASFLASLGSMMWGDTQQANY